ncbi:MAG: hypothetical protein GX066_03740 [Clostridiaceae bacterium]|nr:hypothetical protein [Clostridiaceae bacterium]
MERICFAVLAHEKRRILKDMLANIRYFCPNSSIVLYNGGSNPQLCRNLGYPVCPYSKKMQWGNLAQFMLDIMKWLDDTGYQYDYLINLDSDALFARKGFESFIISQMKDADYMAVRARVYGDKWYPGREMKRRWSKWQPLLKTEQFLGCFNVGQVFSKDLVKKILSSDDIDKIQKNIIENGTFALEEILYVTLAHTLGVKIKSYPEDVAGFIRSRHYFTLFEVSRYIKSNAPCYLLHPVRRDMNDNVRRYIRRLMSGYSKNSRRHLTV